MVNVIVKMLVLARGRGGDNGTGSGDEDSGAIATASAGANASANGEWGGSDNAIENHASDHWCNVSYDDQPCYHCSVDDKSILGRRCVHVV